MAPGWRAIVSAIALAGLGLVMVILSLQDAHNSLTWTYSHAAVVSTRRKSAADQARRLRDVDEDVKAAVDDEKEDKATDDAAGVAPVATGKQINDTEQNVKVNKADTRGEQTRPVTVANVTGSANVDGKHRHAHLTNNPSAQNDDEHSSASAKDGKHTDREHVGSANDDEKDSNATSIPNGKWVQVFVPYEAKKGSKDTVSVNEGDLVYHFGKFDHTKGWTWVTLAPVTGKEGKSQSGWVPDWSLKKPLVPYEGSFASSSDKGALEAAQTRQDSVTTDDAKQGAVKAVGSKDLSH